MGAQHRCMGAKRSRTKPGPAAHHRARAERRPHRSAETRGQFFEQGLHAATGYDIPFAGTAKQRTDQIKEMFDATGGRICLSP